ncbi:DUF4159 domain-containing protein [bacterium]|nr:DUF4159 domain-containing protein [bacterium]
MDRAVLLKLLAVALFLSVCMTTAVEAQQDKLTEQNVLRAIKLGRDGLLGLQQGDGSFKSSVNPVGTSALATLALLNSGMTPGDREMALALDYLRSTGLPDDTYALSLLAMVYSLADQEQDRLQRLRPIVRVLSDSQIPRGDMKGCWDYKPSSRSVINGDRSNGQFAVLGLYEAAHAGITVDRRVWEDARDHWLRSQNADGGWGYSPSNPGSYGSMTVAGIGVLVMTSAMLQEDGPLDADGNPQCCRESEQDEALERALRWLTTHFTVGSNPQGGQWLFYYLYGLERAGRLSGRRFFGEHDWYRRGAEFLVIGQDERSGFWQRNAGGVESDPAIASSLSLLFLSKGLAPVLINKLKFDRPGDDPNAISRHWNRHQFDIRNLTDRITGSDGWPKLLTWQVVDMNTVREHGGLEDLAISRILYLSSDSPPAFNERDLELLRQYINTGGLIFAVNNCNSAEFDDGMHQLVAKMYPNGETSLQKLTADHPVFRAEYLLDPESVELLGADFGCRTSIIYSPRDLGCLWTRWGFADPPNRPDALKSQIEKAMRIGVNVVAYATGREPPNKFEGQELAVEDDQIVSIRRSLTQIAEVRHTGGWDTAPKASRNLMIALNKTVGLTVSTKPAAVTPSDETLFDYSMLMMHGRERFSMSDREIDRLRAYLDRGRLLFADACCGSKPFDQAFRAFVAKLYPDTKLERIPVDDELFNGQIGHVLDRVRRRVAGVAAGGRDGNIVAGEPFLEGIRVNGRWVVIYSKYDISCALERQSTVACAGYLPDDAVKIGVNVVLYSSQHNTRLPIGK